ncbi:pentapeptide repeat domain protein [Syntrophotalea carbinolica DSM 2380]|uniref:Pentapeptide repeat domain protein n=2 Tax=Syntrophotalea carbinolica TaxID=19 RepID=Q3A0P8_SYNC1|nr:pentapeptide repeat domain protein [Syntrophotalea carbinolica DSM 2380]
MNIFQNDFESKWENLSKDVKKLNDYTQTHTVELRNVKSEKLKIQGAIFVGATFINVEWFAVNANNTNLTKVLFKKCKFVGGKWQDAVMTDVVFEDCEFSDTSLSGSTMTNVCFKNCKIDRTGIAYLKGGRVEIDGGYWDTGAGGDSSCEFIIRNCSLGGISFSMMKNHVPILFEDCLLDEIDFYGSHFSDVILRRVRQGEGGVKFNDLTANSMRFEDVNMTRGTAIARSKVKSVTINGGNFGTTFAHSMIGQIYIRDANLTYTDFCEAKLPKVTISNCQLYNTGMWDGYIEELTVYNSEFNIIDGDNFKANIVAWDNVTLDGRIDLTNAQIKDFRLTRLKRGPRLQLITTGANIRF